MAAEAMVVVPEGLHGEMNTMMSAEYVQWEAIPDPKSAVRK
jgi:hypothetical protein